MYKCPSMEQCSNLFLDFLKICAMIRVWTGVHKIIAEVITMNIAIVTGASSGLGVWYAKTIMEMYPNLDEIWLIARRRNRLENFAKQHKQVTVRPVVLDLSQNSSYDELEQLLEREKPNIKILVNNAGFERPGAFVSMKKADILSMIDLNVKGFTMVNRVCLPYMRAGSVGIMTCSVSSFCPVPNQAVYSASKIYVRFMSRALREEVRKDGINILTMCPGNMDTEMNPKGGTSQSDKVDKLPFLDMEKITKRSIVLAKKGHALYTPGGFYKAYRVVSKILPSAGMIKIVGKSFDEGGTHENRSGCKKQKFYKALAK